MPDLTMDGDLIMGSNAIRFGDCFIRSDVNEGGGTEGIQIIDGADDTGFQYDNGTLSFIATGGEPESGTIDLSNGDVDNISHLIFSEGAEAIFDTTTGTVHGTAANQKQSWWGATAVVQPASANQAALSDGSGGIASTSIPSISDPNTAIAIASLARLVNQLRNDLVLIGKIKGSA